jgi:hypothetical protein
MSLPAALMLTAFLFFGSSDDKPHLSDLQVSLEGTRVAVSFELVNAFGDELFERIQTGLASGFSFQFVLVREQRRWFDDKIDSSTLQVIAMYNAVTREYLVNYKQDGKLTDSRVTRTRVELEQAMTRFEKLTVFHVDEVKSSPRRRALVRARAELGSKTMLLIIPTRVQTDWIKSEKFSLPSSQP